MPKLYITAISGLCVGFELFLGDDLVDNDKFACTLDLGIIRLTFVIEGN